MSAASMTARLAKLEGAGADRLAVYVWQHEHETQEEAKARWRAEHPGEDLGKAGLQVVLVGWLRSPDLCDA